MEKLNRLCTFIIQSINRLNTNETRRRERNQLKLADVVMSPSLREPKYPKVSLIIPNLNGKHLLRECLLSLLNLDYPNYEIIVSDGGSTDGTCQMIESEFKRVILVREEGAGIGRANNLGIKVATGEIIAFDVNNDEVFKQDWLRKLVEVLLSSPEIGVVGGSRIVYGTKEVLDEGGYKFNFLGLARNNHGLVLEQLPRDPVDVDFVGIPLSRRSLLDKVGICDEEYQVYFEDSDFCLRVKNAGYRILWVPPAISYHRRATTTGSSTRNLDFILLRNRLRFFIINWKLRFLLPALMFQISVFPVIRLFYSLLKSSVRTLARNSRWSFLYIDDPASYSMALPKALLWNLKNLRFTLHRRIHINSMLSR